MPPKGVTRRSCSAVQLARASSAAHARIVRNFRISNYVPFAPGARLAVEQRPAVADEIAEEQRTVISIASATESA